MKNYEKYLELIYKKGSIFSKLPIQEIQKWMNLLSGKLTDSMHKDEQDRFRNNGQRNVQDTGWRKLPNVREFKIVLNEWNPMLSLGGLLKRDPPSIRVKRARLRKANKFMEHQIRRLKKCRNNPKLYWTIALSLVQRSNVFRTSAWNKVVPNWHRNLPWNLVMAINRKVSDIANGKSALPMKSTRRYIPKANKKLRPLGVPFLEYRIFLHMIHNFLELYARSHVPDQNHAYTFGKGTLTAWRAIINEKVLDAKYIYETDLTKFFDSVQHWAIRNALNKTGMPEGLIHAIMKINSSWPSKPHRMTEQEESEWVNEEHSRSPDNWTVPEFAAISQNLNWMSWSEQRTKGVAQGSPLSGLLAILTLHRFLWPETIGDVVKSISYADDPLFYSDSDFEIKDRPVSGIVQNPEKSRWLKRDGKWLVTDFTFLGINYSVKDDTIRASTRKGSTLKLTRKMIKLSQLYEILCHERPREELSRSLGVSIDDRWKSQPGGWSWRETLTGKLSGLITARIYSGAWNLETINQDFEFTWIKNSLIGNELWYRKAQKLYPDQPLFKPWDTFTSSTLASHVMLEVLRSKSKRISRRYPSLHQRLFDTPSTSNPHLVYDGGKSVGPNREFIEAIKAKKAAQARQNNATDSPVLLLG